MDKIARDIISDAGYVQEKGGVAEEIAATADSENPGWYYAVISAEKPYMYVTSEDGEKTTYFQACWITVDAETMGVTSSSSKQTSGELIADVPEGCVLTYLYVPENWGTPKVMAGGIMRGSETSEVEFTPLEGEGNEGWYYAFVNSEQMMLEITSENGEYKGMNKGVARVTEELEEAEKNAAYANAVAPIDGMVIGLSITPGQEITASATALTISDTNTVTISATVDERNVSYLKVGMGVDLNQWGNPSFGTISSVSLSSSVNNGVATYPFTIEADNADGTLQINSNINYNLTASQSDNCLVLPIQAVRTVGLEDGTSATVVYLKADSMPDNAIELPYSDETIPEGFYPVQVEIGIQDNNNVEIKSGVEQGAEVFTQYMTGSATSWDNYGMVY